MGVAVECCLGADIGTFLEHSSHVAVEHCHLEPSCQPHGTFRTFSGNGHGAFGLSLAMVTECSGHSLAMVMERSGHSLAMVRQLSGHFTTKVPESILN